MIEIGIMLEGQEGLTWSRWFRLAETVEELGFDFLFRSDHLKPLEVSQPRETLALWPSLTALALRTKRIRFGPMVSPMTFRRPATVAKMAASVSQLSGGRLDLGLGAGWNEDEHKMFGIRYPRYPIRLAMLEEGVQVIRMLWQEGPSSFEGNHYRLENAVGYSRPESISIIMGGKGEKTLKVVARHADEWNCSYAGVKTLAAKSRELDENCVALHRDPATLKRSVMIPFVIGKDEDAVQSRINAQRAMFPTLPADLEGWRDHGFIGGSPGQVIDQLATFAEAGVERFMLQHNDLDDLDSLALLAEEVLPHMRSRRLT
jgi:alkanesulfonate monooxygenase SsuD/methylene tetrahydromethanopterin reductase-like flavin-dependent oxidoreductase (luciferase family)